MKISKKLRQAAKQAFEWAAMELNEYNFVDFTCISIENTGGKTCKEEWIELFKPSLALYHSEWMNVGRFASDTSNNIRLAALYAVAYGTDEDVLLVKEWVEKNYMEQHGLYY